MAQREFLVAYDYGTGGLWAVVVAGSEDAITREYPELVVAREPPPWMDDTRYAKLRAEALSLDAPPEGLFKAVIAERAK